MKKIYLAACSFLLLCACSKELCFSPPEPFRLRVENAQAEDLLDPVVCPQLKLVYLEGLDAVERTLTITLMEKTDTVSNRKVYFLESVDAPWKSLEGLKTFKLYRANLNPDLIVLDVQERTSGQCAYHATEGVSFNGQDIKGQRDVLTGAFVAKIP